MRAAATLAAPATFASVSRDFLELSKARIVVMVLLTTAAGYLMAAPEIVPLALVNVLIGTALLASGTNALNQYVEREHDATMERTRFRPIPDGRMTPRTALVFSSAISVLGAAFLAFAVNPLTAALGVLTLGSYIFIYTPLKRVSTMCTVVGAVPGAIPPLMGWAAATGSLQWGGWLAFAVVFLWQMPHFFAISWMYRDDYERAGFAMLSVRDHDGRATARQAVLYTAALIATTLVPAMMGVAGGLYVAAALLAGSIFVAAALTFLRARTRGAAFRLFMTSNFYLLTMMLLLVLTFRT